MALSVVSPSERERLAATPVRRRYSEFIQMWTLKEAYAKCSGAGATLNFADINTSLEPLNVHSSAEGQHPAEAYRFHQMQWRLDRERNWVTLAVAPRAEQHRTHPSQPLHGATNS